MNSQLLSIIIVNYNAPEMLARCLASIDVFLTTVAKEVIVVDNSSRTESLDVHPQQYPYLKVIRLRENLGFGRANNIGVASASGRVILLLNSDTELIDHSLIETLRRFEQSPGRTLWGLKLLWPDGTFQNSFSREIKFFDYLFTYTPLSFFFQGVRRVKAHKFDGLPFPDLREVDVIYGTAMLMFREDFLALNGFGHQYFMYFEDIDFCDRFREQLGGHIFFYPFTMLVHHVMGSSRLKKNVINWMYLKSKYIYGINKFGAWRMFFILLLDIPLLTTQVIYSRLLARC